LTWRLLVSQILLIFCFSSPATITDHEEVRAKADTSVLVETLKCWIKTFCPFFSEKSLLEKKHRQSKTTYKTTNAGNLLSEVTVGNGL